MPAGLSDSTELVQVRAGLNTRRGIVVSLSESPFWQRPIITILEKYGFRSPTGSARIDADIPYTSPVKSPTGLVYLDY
jgi:hypothetical protein